MQSKNDIYRFAARNTLLITSSLLPIALNILPPVAQLDNAADSDSEEWGFKSLRVGQKNRLVSTSRFFYPLRKQWYIIHDSVAIVVSHQSVRTVYHHAKRVSKNFRNDDIQSVALMIYTA